MDDTINSILNGNSQQSSGIGDTIISILGGGLGQSGLPAIQSSSPTSASWDDFKSMAADTVNTRGLPHAVLPVLLGQAALESARGTAAPGNNYFGIKGAGTAGSNNLATKEYGANGYYGENSDFGAYKTPQDSIDAYLDLISKYRGVPQAMQSGSPAQIIQAIKANGYATSPTYVRDVMATPEYQQYGQ